MSPYLWRASAFLATDAVMGLAGLAVLTVLGAAVCLVPAGLVGVPLVILAGWALHLLGAAERHRWAVICELDVPPQPRPPLSGPLLASVAALARSRSSWRLVAYFAVLVPWSLVTLLGIVLVWGAPLALVLLPAYYAQLPSGAASLGLITVGDLGTALLVSAVTLLLWATLAPLLVRGLLAADMFLARTLLALPRDVTLAQRVEYLAESRARVVDAAEAERRRIERDLHDGAQQRLVAMAMTLGRARSRLKDLQRDSREGTRHDSFDTHSTAMTTRWPPRWRERSSGGRRRRGSSGSASSARAYARTTASDGSCTPAAAWDRAVVERPARFAISRYTAPTRTCPGSHGDGPAPAGGAGREAVREGRRRGEPPAGTDSSAGRD